MKKIILAVATLAALTSAAQADNITGKVGQTFGTVNGNYDTVTKITLNDKINDKYSINVDSDISYKNKNRSVNIDLKYNIKPDFYIKGGIGVDIFTVDYVSTTSADSDTETFSQATVNVGLGYTTKWFDLDSFVSFGSKGGLSGVTISKEILSNFSVEVAAEVRLVSENPVDRDYDTGTLNARAGISYRF